MKNTIIGLLLMTVLFVSCADSKSLVIEGKEVEVETYGWMNEDKYKNDKVVYKVNTGNIIWSVLLVETVVAPILITGLDLWEPVRVKGGFTEKPSQEVDLDDFDTSETAEIKQ